MYIPVVIPTTKEIIERSKLNNLVGLTDDIRDIIINETARGNSILTICRKYNLKESQIKGWLYADKDLNELYRMAQDESHLARFNDIETLSETALDEVKKLKDNPKMHKYAQVLLNAFELKIDTMKWTLSKINPRKYSEKMDITSGGQAIGGNTIVFANFSGNKSADNNNKE